EELMKKEKAWREEVERVRREVEEGKEWMRMVEEVKEGLEKSLSMAEKELKEERESRVGGERERGRVGGI
ncbi:hypothetical protein MMC15_002564, partial [Xylographa vitiligo]|nr:hypothetical protein [Xylographa vitiligo]